VDPRSPWLTRIRSDFASTPAARIDVRLLAFDPAQPEEVALFLPDADEWVDSEHPLLHRLLLQIASSVTSVDELAGDPSAVAVAIASHLQDYVMDQLGRPWPEVMLRGRATVLEPRLGRNRLPRWEGRGIAFCGIGDLGCSTRRSRLRIG
jgi:hypothetical protein